MSFFAYMIVACHGALPIVARRSALLASRLLYFLVVACYGAHSRYCPVLYVSCLGWVLRNATPRIQESGKDYITRLIIRTWVGRISQLPVAFGLGRYNINLRVWSYPSR